MEIKPSNHREVRETALVHLRPTAENSQNGNKKEQRGLFKNYQVFALIKKKVLNIKMNLINHDKDDGC